MNALLALLLCGGLAAARPESGADALASVLEARRELGEAPARERLLGLGVEAVPAVAARLLDVDAAAGPLPFADRSFLLASLDDLPAAALVAELGLRVERAGSLDARLALMEALGATHHPDAVALLIEAHEALPDGQRQQSLVRRRLRDSLVELLEAAPEGCDVLHAAAFGEQRSATLAQVAIEALGACGRLRAVPALGRALAHRPGLEAAALLALGRLRPLRGGELLREGHDLAVARLAHAEAPVRAAAATALIPFGDFADLQLLVPLLADAQSTVRRAASDALARLTGLRMEQDAAAWRHWLQREAEWLEVRLPALEAELRADNLAGSLAGVRELAARPWHRARTAELLGLALSSSESAVAAGAAAQLGRLGGPAATEALVEALRDGREAVRAAAHAGLIAGTGADLPLEYFTWREHLLGQR